MKWMQAIFLDEIRIKILFDVTNKFIRVKYYKIRLFGGRLFTFVLFTKPWKNHS
jgi:hypothetical protein